MGRRFAEIDERLPRTTDSIQLKEQHHRVMRYILLGYNNMEIEKLTGFSQSFISVLRNSPVVQEQVRILTAARDSQAVSVAQMIQEYAPKAAQHLMTVIDGHDAAGNPTMVDPKTRVQVCQDWLSRSGHSPIQRGSFENVTRRVAEDDTIDEIKRRKEAMDRARADAGFSLSNKENFADAEVVDFTESDDLRNTGT